MRQPEPELSHALNKQSQRWQPTLPEQRLAEVLRRIHATPVSLAPGQSSPLASTLQTICQAVKSACAVDQVQLWLVDDYSGQGPRARRLKRWAWSGRRSDPAAPALVDPGNDSVISHLLWAGHGSSQHILNKEAPGTLVSALFTGAAGVLLVPLAIDERPLGMLALLNERAAEDFPADTAALAELLAGHVALAVQNAQLFAAARERAVTYERGLGVVAHTAETITSTLHLSEVSEQIVSVICSFLGAQASWLMVYDEEADLLRIEAICGWDAVRDVEIVPGKSVAGEVLFTGRPTFVPDVQADPRFAVKREAAEAGIIAMLGLPLMANGRVVGVLGVNPAPGPDGIARNPLEGPDGDWLRLFAGQAGAAVQNARLYESLQAEHALAERMAHASQRHAGEMETIFESMAEGVAVFDTNGQLVRLNRAGASLAGVSTSKLLTLSATALGTGISEKVASKEFGLVRHPLILRALAGEVINGEELTMTRADGVQVALQVSVAPLYDRQEQVAGAVAIMEDVTERQEYQRRQLAVGWVAAALNHPLDLKETLDTAVEALTAALGADDSAIMLADEGQGVLRIASQRGYGGFSKIFPVLPIDAPLNPSLAFRTRKVQVFDTSVGDALGGSHPLYEALKQDGLQASLSAPLLAQDQALGVLVYSYTKPHHFSANEQQVARAIADQIALAVVNARLYEEVADYAAWEENERRTLQTIIDALPAGIILRDEHGKLFMYNEAALKLAFNYAEMQSARQAGQMSVEPVWKVTRPDGTPVEAGAFPSQLAVQTGKPVREMQFLLRQTDGRMVPVLTNAVSVQDTDSNFTLGLAVFQDITALKELERHKDEFISVASHELRGPLTVIRGQAQLLQRQLRRQEKQGELPQALLHVMESIESIESQTARLNDLVNDLLDVSRIQAGKLTLQRGTALLAPLVTKAVQHWKPASDRHTLSLEMNIPTEEVVGHWDARRVEQILNNLIANALKYSPEGGEVNVCVEVEDERKQVLISVRDEGVGIPPEALPHLFERFYRAGNVSSIGGTGLGLYISQRLAVAHGGDLWAESPGLAKGSVFYLRLPLE
jgi:PAS domain S-box-containing protein